MKNSQKSVFSKILLKKTHEAEFFSKTFFDENVAYDPAHFLAKTWCPYLFWVLRNLPHKFEKLVYVTESAKKNVTKWASRKARAPKTKRGTFWTR